jgi:hypothetical protein
VSDFWILHADHYTYTGEIAVRCDGGEDWDEGWSCPRCGKMNEQRGICEWCGDNSLIWEEVC